MKGEAAEVAKRHSEEIARLTSVAASKVVSPFPLMSKEETGLRCRANMAHIRQSRSDSGLGVQMKVLRTLSVVPSSLGNGSTVSFRN